MTNPPTRLYLALTYMVAMGAIWGLQFSTAKIGRAHGIPPSAWVFWMGVSGAAVLLAISAARGGRPWVLAGEWRYAIVAGATAVAIPNTIMALVVGHVPAGIAALLNTLSPLMTYAIALGLRMDALHRLRVAGLGFGFAGAVLVLGPRASLPDPAMWPWVALCLWVPFFYAASNIYIGRFRPPGAESIGLGGAMQAGAVASVLPLALVDGFYVPLPPAHPGDWALLAQASVNWIGSLLFFEVMRLAGPVFFSQTGFLVTLCGVFWGWLLFGETHSAYVWAAMVAIFAGLALVTRAGR
ncbi:MAG: DMT family transporter [Azospirillum sp.]|nr:DMT family transporter [Azospirillum sp.]